MEDPLARWRGRGWTFSTDFCRDIRPGPIGRVAARRAGGDKGRVVHRDAPIRFHHRGERRASAAAHVHNGRGSRPVQPVCAPRQPKPARLFVQIVEHGNVDAMAAAATGGSADGSGREPTDDGVLPGKLLFSDTMGQRYDRWVRMAGRQQPGAIFDILRAWDWGWDRTEEPE
jgi:hypothetical protein